MMLNELFERIDKTNNQRMLMANLLVEIMKGEQLQSNLHMRVQVAGSLVSMIQSHMIPEDKILKQVINDAINLVCKEFEQETGETDFRGRLEETITRAKSKFEENQKREKVADDILKSINFDDINWN